MNVVKQIDKPLTLSDNVVSEATIIEKGGVSLSSGGNGPQLGTIDFAGGKIYPVTRCLIMSIIDVPIAPMNTAPFKRFQCLIEMP